MSISSPLRAAARSVYRDLWRASGTTFAGDPPILLAFRQKIRRDSLEQYSVADEEVFKNNLKLGREIADFLRKNIVQAERLQMQPGEETAETYKIRITEHTELGDNDTIKTPENMVEMPRRRRGKEEKGVTVDSEVQSVAVPRFYSQMKKAHKERVIPVLNENDLEESFVRGSGPGGQSINKTENNVQLLHKPTRIRVSCQETRSLKQNRKIARRILLDKLDDISNPGLSKREIQKAKHLERERRRRKKAKKARLRAEEAVVNVSGSE
ncbi:RF-1 domain-containing protein [Russula ochroleuca]|uniref:RF-1 domain-containing protein n=1 Tax=Russula ochroleuca TaxID=152965 RepID=A0A9P5T8J0_9AGAM|nr:RF-1 domain-containing protein [Russula ochroleuca]